MHTRFMCMYVHRCIHTFETIIFWRVFCFGERDEFSVSKTKRERFKTTTDEPVVVGHTSCSSVWMERSGNETKVRAEWRDRTSPHQPLSSYNEREEWERELSSTLLSLSLSLLVSTPVVALPLLLHDARRTQRTAQTGETLLTSDWLRPGRCALLPTNLFGGNYGIFVAACVFVRVCEHVSVCDCVYKCHLTQVSDANRLGLPTIKAAYFSCDTFKHIHIINVLF